MKLLNAFSLNMVKENLYKIEVLEIDTLKAEVLLTWNQIDNCIGHKDTNAVIQSLLNVDIGIGQRKTVTLKANESAIVAQYIGPRLTEGCTQLPEGATIKWYTIRLITF